MKLLPSWFEGLSPDMVKKARDELGETPETQAEAILDLRNMINEDPDFICPEDDSFLIRFLRFKKYNYKKAFRALKNFYEFKKKDPGLLTDKTKKILDAEMMFVPPLRAPDGGVLAIFYSGSIDFKKYTVEEIFSAGLMCCEQYAELEAHQVLGCHAIFDFKGITLKKMITLATSSFFVQIVKALEDCWPHRINSITTVNEPFYLNIVYNVVWPLMSKKLRERISFLGSNYSLLHKKFPKEMLPEKLGGMLGQKAYDEFRDKMIANQIEIERNNKYSFHRVHKPVRKHSTCGLEEKTKFSQGNTNTISNAAN